MFSSTSHGLKQSEECSGNSSNILVPCSHTPFRRHGKNGSSLFELASEEDDEEVQFDTSDSDIDHEMRKTGKHYPSIQEFASAIPNHLLLGSLLEHLCFVYESNPARSRMLFKVIGQRLAALNLLSPLAISDEFSTVRLQHNRAFTELLHAASSSLYPQGQQLVSTSTHSFTVRSKEGLFQAQTSRYLSDFEEVCQLGKGSYGKVFKVINKLDGQCYAVKKILIKNVSMDDCMKVHREAKVLSSLQHVNIVGYHTAWMEHVQPAPRPLSVLPALESPAQQDSTDESPDSRSSSSIVFQSHSYTNPESAASAKVPTEMQAPGQAFVSSEPRIPKNYVPCVFLGQRAPSTTTTAAAKCPAMSLDTSALGEEEEDSRSSTEMKSNKDKEFQQWADKHKAKEVQFHLMLYIQMQLCERSLKDWISERNSRPREESDSGDPYWCIDAEHSLSLLRKTLEGVEYIHSRGIMHRDLKPRNIFLHGNDCHIRIGDFGLACKDIIVDKQKSSTSDSCDSSHTTGVGTFVYAAPEQLKGSHYDSKSDMYSIGVLALELFHPFGTEMERVRTLVDLREGKIPDSFCRRWPVLAEHIMKLTSKEPSARPTASQLLQSELFSSKDTVIHGLQRRVEEQEEEIMQLRRLISQLRSSQTSLLTTTTMTTTTTAVLGVSSDLINTDLDSPD